MGRKAAAIVALIGFWVLPVRAQFHGSAGGHAVAMRPGVAVKPAAAPQPVRNMPVVARSRQRPMSRNATVIAASALTGTSTFPIGFSDGTVQDLFGFPTPGLGFDFPHLAAVNGNLGVRALIDPATQAQIALALRIRGFNSGFVSPFFWGGGGGYPIVMETPGVVAQQSEAPPAQPPIIVVTQPAAAQPAPQAAQVAQEQPLPDPGEFVLVQRDGRLLFAVGFTSEPGRVVYVTKEGLRRSIALDQLDVDSTLRMNEERGSSIQIPRV